MLKLKKAWVVVALYAFSACALFRSPCRRRTVRADRRNGDGGRRRGRGRIRPERRQRRRGRGVLGAIDYTGSYADNLQSDENFEENVDKAIATVHTEIPAYATFWALLPPLIAIALALITKEVYSSPLHPVSLWAACFMQTLISRVRLFMLSAPDLWRP